MSALRHIVLKSTLQPLDRPLTVDHCVHLKVQAKAPDIHVRGPDACDHPVNAQCFCMEKSIVIHVAFCAGRHHFSDIEYVAQ